METVSWEQVSEQAKELSIPVHVGAVPLMANDDMQNGQKTCKHTPSALANVDGCHPRWALGHQHVVKEV